MRFIALLHPPVDRSPWGVTFPDLPGCTSAGASFEEASVNAAQALQGHLAAMLADGEIIPRRRSLREIQTDPSTREERESAYPLLVTASDATPELALS